MSITLPEFRPPVWEDARWIPLLQKCPSRCCEYTFANIMMWRRHYQTEIALVDNTLFIRFQGEGPTYLAPTGDAFEEGVQTLRAFCSREGHPLLLFGYDEDAMDRLAATVPVADRQEFEDEFDYLYRVRDLARLEGKKYHSKRNHIAAFSRAYDWTYEPLSAENGDEVHRLADDWCTARTAQTGDADGALQDENEAIHELLHHREEVQLAGGLLRVDKKAVAFTFGAPLCADTFDTLVEKALPEYAGAYAVINREFAARALGSYTYVNRENDVGSEGLRRAKRSYHPALMVKKTLCTIIGD